ncbi:Hypothetical predicted protein, partial [Paramuricea clavata]
MAALCYILYENIVKFPANRLFSFSLSLKVTAANWILSLVLVPAFMSGFYLADKQSIGRICETNIDQAPTHEETASFFSLIVLVTIWITVCARIIRKSLSGVASKLKQHREQTQQALHNMSKVKRNPAFVKEKKETVRRKLARSLTFYLRDKFKKRRAKVEQLLRESRER